MANPPLIPGPRLVDPANLAVGNVYMTGLDYESYTDNLTAHAGGGQASALQLTTEINRITTVATTGDSIALPPSGPGLTIMVINHGANACQVYGYPGSTDTIDDVAYGTGVSQMPGSVTFYVCATAGAWYAEGLGTGYSGGLQTIAFADALTAHAGGGQTNALPLTASVNRVTTVASANDSVKLPPSSPGLEIQVINSAATNSMQVYGTGTDQINGAAAATGVAVAAGKQANFTCYTAGNWYGPVALA